MTQLARPSIDFNGAQKHYDTEMEEGFKNSYTAQILNNGIGRAVNSASKYDEDYTDISINGNTTDPRLEKYQRSPALNAFIQAALTARGDNPIKAIGFIRDLHYGGYGLRLFLKSSPGFFARRKCAGEIYYPEQFCSPPGNIPAPK